jgi:hypothetical protein
MIKISNTMDFHTGMYLCFYKPDFHFCRTKRWWKRVFFHLLDVAVANGMIIHSQFSPKRISQFDFRLAVIGSLLEGHVPREDRRHYAPQRDLPVRLSERAFPERIPESINSTSKGRPLCEVCRARGKRSQTRYRC